MKQESDKIIIDSGDGDTEEMFREMLRQFLRAVGEPDVIILDATRDLRGGVLHYHVVAQRVDGISAVFTENFH